MVNPQIINYIEQTCIKNKSPQAALVDVRLIRFALEAMEQQLVSQCTINEIKDVFCESEFERMQHSRRLSDLRNFAAKWG